MCVEIIIPMSSSSKQGRYWCFTLNNYTDDDVLLCHCTGEDRERCDYLVFGYEFSDSGTPHLQGYIELPKRLRRKPIKQLLGQRVHLELRRGSAHEAAEYCKKGGDYVEFGQMGTSIQGERADLDAIRAQIDAGVSELSLAQNYFSRWVVYRRSFDAYRQLVTNNGIRTELRVIVLWGLPGVGKSRYVYDRYPGLYSVPDATLRWFDGYAGEETLLLDDYRGGAESSFLLKLLDIYPLRLPFKGGFTCCRAKRIFITSNLAPPFHHEDIYEPLARRLHHTIEVTESMTMEEIDAIIQ